MAATGKTTYYEIPYPNPTDPVKISSDIKSLAEKVDAQLYSNLGQDVSSDATPTFAGINIVNGDISLNSHSIIFEGSVADNFETVLVATNPTADRTIQLPDSTGTIALISESTMASLINIANSTSSITMQIGYGATTNGTTKTINIGPNGVSGSTTNINIGSTIAGALGTTTINSPTFNITGNSLTLLSSVSSSPSSNALINVNRGSQNDVSIRWNESNDSWEYTNDGVTFNQIGSGGTGGSANISDIINASLLLAGM